MNPIDPVRALAAEAVRDRVELGRRARLAKFASCCHPNALGRLVMRLRASRSSRELGASRLSVRC